MLMRYSGGGVGHVFQVPTAGITPPEATAALPQASPGMEDIHLQDIVEQDYEVEDMDSAEGDQDEEGRVEIDFVGDAEDPTLNEDENSGDDYEEEDDDDELDEDTRMGFRF